MRRLTLSVIGMLLVGCDRGPTATPSATTSRTTPASAVSGSVSRDGVSFPVVEAYASWEPKKRALTFLLLPTVLTPEERVKVQKETPFFTLCRKTSPDPAKWKQYPYAEFELTFAEGAGRARENITTLHLFGYSIKKEGMSDNFNTGGADAVERVKALDLKVDDVGGSVTLATDGDESYMDGKFGWTLNLTLPVSVKKE